MSRRSLLGIVLPLVAVALPLLIVWAQVADAGDPPEGFGSQALGGGGGQEITVTSLADSGPGTLREALSRLGPRIITFAVGGTIDLQSRIRIVNGRVTVDGSTAPGGITIRTHGLTFVGDCDDIIVRHLRIRVLTGGGEGDCLTFWGKDGGTVERVLIDHCSLMWATDEVVNTWGQVRDVTCQWTIIAKAQLPHSKAWLSGVGSDGVTIHHCLFAQNADRNPKLEGGRYDFVNNVVYNWSINNCAKLQTGAKVNVIGNCFLGGPQSSPAKGTIFVDGPGKGTQVFVSGNWTDLTQTEADDQWESVTWYEQAGGQWVEHSPAPEQFRAPQRFEGPAVRATSATEAYAEVMAKAGTNQPDEDDLRVLEEVKARSGKVGK